MGADLLSIGNSGLFAAKKSLETTGHNIANANTEGYSRQIVKQQNNEPIGSGNLVFGTGTKVSSINRVHDKLIESRLLGHTSDESYHRTRSDKLSIVEGIFNEVDADGLNHLVNNFFNAFRNLSNQPENETTRSVVRETSKLVVKDFHRIKNLLEDTAKQIEHNVQTQVQEINSMLQSVAGLNKRIVEIENIHGETGDLRDQRDLIIRSLSEHFSLQTSEDSDGNYNIQVDRIGSLVTGGMAQELTTRKTSRETSSNDKDGSVEIYLKERPNNPISTQFKRGTLAALMETRNEDIKSLNDSIDYIAYNLANSVNAIHRRGFVNKLVPTYEDGSPKSTHGMPVTGINFFREPNMLKDAALNFNLSEHVLFDLNNITTALSINSPGDNRVAIALSKLQHEKILGDGALSFEESYLESVGQIGIAARKSEIERDQVEAILTQTKTVKERISGVSIDEEAANMMKQQQVYDASARVLRTANETFKSVLELI